MTSAGRVGLRVVRVAVLPRPAHGPGRAARAPPQEQGAAPVPGRARAAAALRPPAAQGHAGLRLAEVSSYTSQRTGIHVKSYVTRVSVHDRFL